jgi:hypothetical protein
MAEWQQAKFTVIPKETLDGINNALDSAIAFLDKIDQALSALEALVSILALLESLVNDFFNVLLKGIIDDFLRMVNDFKYTGVYALDLTSHNWIGNRTSIEPVEKEGIIEKWARQTKGAFSGENISGVSFQLPRSKKTIEAPAFNILTYYKRQTYREWVRTITDAFNDANDLPDSSLRQDLVDKITNAPPKEPTNKTSSQVAINAQQPHPYSLSYLRPGRPNFGPTGNINCYVFAFAIGDILTFLQTLGTFSKVFWSLTDFSEYEEMAKKYKEIYDALQLNQFNPGTWDLLPGEYSNQRGTPPDFIGLNAAQLLQPLFDILEKLANKLKSIFKEVNTGLSKFLQATIEALRKQIEELRAVVSIIRQLVRLLSDLLNLNGLYMLHIESTTGIEGILEQLNSATGFKGDTLGQRQKHGTTNPKLYIGGALFCYGYPSTDSDNYNLSEAWDKRRARMKEKEVNIADTYNKNRDIIRELMK